MSVHTTQHPHAGKTVTLAEGVRLRTPDGWIDAGGRTVLIEDWWDRLAGQSWSVTSGNPACLNYAMRCGPANLPLDDQVIYVKDVEPPALGHLVHTSEVA